jgi:outer membrane biosynthesis protein TonB
MKVSFNEAMRGVVAKFLFIALFITSAPVFADTLVAGSVYFDSVQTLNEVNKLSAQHDNEGIAKLTENGHISKQTGGEMDIVVLLSGSTPDDPAEFRFLNGPTTYWTLTRNVANLTRPIETSTPVPTATRTLEPKPTPVPTESPTSTLKPKPTPVPTESPTSTLKPKPTPVPTESPTPTSKHYQRKHKSNAPFDDDNGRRIWHQVDGKWKWYPANKHDVPVKKALPADGAPKAAP